MTKPLGIIDVVQSSLALVLLLSGCATDLGKKIGDSVNAELVKFNVATGPKAVDAAGLRNILPQYDPNKSTSTQFPHVAVTILKSPPMWADLAYDPSSKTWFSGCFTLSAVVWTDKTHSRTVDPFDWCSPRDLEVKPGAGGMTQAAFNAMPSGYDLTSEYLTGITRTNGPRPPSTLAPSDRQTADLQMMNSTSRSSRDLSSDTGSKFGVMFWNLRHAMGQTLTEHDFRVWIVRIEK